MSDHEDGSTHLFFCVFKGFDDSAAGFAVQISGGFICQDQQGMIDQASRNSRSLAFPSAGYLSAIWSMPKRLIR